MEVRNKITLTLVYCILNVQFSSQQVAFSELTKIGVIKGRSYDLKVKGVTSDQFIVVKFVPNTTNMTGCGENALTNYKEMVKRILAPINSSLALMKSYYRTKTTGFRFIGAVLGGVALGVATAAQITAGFALHNSIENAKSIRKLKDSITQSNKAIEKLAMAGEKTLIAVNGLQDQINSYIIPSINTIGCEVAGNTFGLKLNQYFSELSLVFGPNLREPASQTISIQALSKAFNNDFESLMRSMGYSGTDLLDLMESHSIRARIIDVDMEELFISLQVEYPALIKVEHAVVQEFSIISYNDKGTEWVSVFPPHLLVRNYLLSNIDLSQCTRTTNSYICQKDTSSPLSQPLAECARGKIENCARERVVGSYVSRYALADGVIFANCMHISCVCTERNKNIVQDSKATSTMVSSDVCNELLIDGIYITVGPKRFDRATYSQDVTVGKAVSTDPIDIGNQLAEAQQDINSAKESVRKSNEILKSVNPNIVNTNAMIAAIVLLVISIVWFIVSLIWLIYLTKKYDKLNHIPVVYNSGSTVNSLSSLIPAT